MGAEESASRSGGEMIRFENVSFSYEKNIRVLDNISFSLQEGERVGLIGANGAGKSTLMKIFLGLLEAQGEVVAGGLMVCRKNLAQVRKKIGFVLQTSDNQMFMPTVYEDMIFGPLNYGVDREEIEEKTDRILARLDISSLKYRHNHKLSGGEKRMAAIATILAMDPEVIVMDEPTASLDPYHRRTVIRTVQSLPQTMLIASHDLDMIWETCSRVILLAGGHVAAEGGTKEILADRALLEDNRLELPYRLQ